MSLYSRYGKRVLDVTGSFILMIPAAPIIGIVSLSLRLVQGRPVFFRHERSGRDGVPFKVLKFRTMDPASSGRTRQERVTKMGAYLRRASLDELPQLYNVLRGDMSLVGPRPLPRRYDDQYNERHRRRLDVRPGLTGLTQVSGRNDLAWDARFDLDIQYMENICLRADLTILVHTFGALFSRTGNTSTAPSLEYQNVTEMHL